MVGQSPAIWGQDSPRFRPKYPTSRQAQLTWDKQLIIRTVKSVTRFDSATGSHIIFDPGLSSEYCGRVMVRDPDSRFSPRSIRASLTAW
jgi:hypothetical protein